jgi:hypothetical protein
MILSNVRMQEALESGRLVIRPQPMLLPEPGQKCPYDTHTVNLTLGCELSLAMSGPYSFDLPIGWPRSTSCLARRIPHGNCRCL